MKITDFQPSVIPMRSSTRLTIVTADQLNAASSSVWCRLGDMSVPAEVKEELVFCDTPPMRDTDKAALHLDVDGKLFKAKKPLRFHGMSATQYRSYFMYALIEWSYTLSSYLPYPSLFSAIFTCLGLGLGVGLG